jgi:hypothetical protein|tara:strand:+ start:15848 stop:16609 length:762 start_codon:yes stop_codon:yes gene_type:complete
MWAYVPKEIMGNNFSDVTVTGCSLEAATYAVENWHYSEGLPSGKLIKIGIWEGQPQEFIGCIIFSRGASPWLGTPYDLQQNQLCELTRIAMRHDHKVPVTYVVAKALKMLKEKNRNIQLVFSFADPDQGHHGGVYQAGNWIYAGVTGTSPMYYINGKWTHNRTVASKMKNGSLRPDFYQWAKETNRTRMPPPKHRYLYPFNRKLRKKILEEQYDPNKPHAVEVSTSDTSSILDEGAGAIPAHRSTIATDNSVH